MKKLFLFPLITALFFLLMTVNSYSLNNFDYTGIAFDASGNILASQNVSVNIQLINSNGVVFEENHSGVSTDQFGAYTVKVGTGTNVSGVLANVNASKDLKIKSTVNSGGVWVVSTLMKPTVAVTVASSSGGGSGNYWNLTGNSGTTSGTNFIGTTDAQDLDIRTNNAIIARFTQKSQLEFLNNGKSVFIGEEAGENDDLSDNENIFIGYKAGNSNTSGFGNIAIGYQTLYYHTNTGNYNTASGYQALYSNTTGDENTATGHQALHLNTTGYQNTATGSGALHQNTSGYHNTADGCQALYYNNTGYYNTATGYQALNSNTTGNSSTAVGYQALYSNTGGGENTATGCEALYNNTTGQYNTANGYQALNLNTTGLYNTATGYKALTTNATSDCNTADGYQALYSNIGGHNTATGYGALYNNNTGSSNTAVGYQALYRNTTGTFNTGVGDSANSTGATLTNSTGLGYNANPTASNSVHIGNTSVSWIGGQVGWSTYSDARFKTNINEDVKGLDFVMKLHPITYHMDIDKQQQILYGKVDKNTWKGKYDIEKIKFSGFIAQEVEQAAKEAGYEFSGVIPPGTENETGEDLYTLRYAEFVVPLVKGMQEQQEIINELREENVQMRERIQLLENELQEIKNSLAK
jgi:hypothetical protein